MDAIESQFDRLPPHSIDAEMCLLASIMLCGEECRLDIVATVKGMVEGEDFFQADHQIIFEAVMARYAAKKKVDGVLLCADLESRQLLEEVGGREYIGRLLNTVPSWRNAEHYAEIVRHKSLLRKLIAASNDALRDAYSPHQSGSAVELLSKMASRCSTIAMRGSDKSVHALGDVVREVAARRNNPDSFKRIPTGLTELDDIIGGIPIGGMTLVGGNPGMGKSALSKQITFNLAERGIKVGYVSLEESRFKIAENYLSYTTRIPNNRIAFGTASVAEWDRINHQADKTDLPFKVIDDAYTLNEVLVAIDLLTFRDGCTSVVVDHFHLINEQRTKAETGDDALTRISHALKRSFSRNNIAGVLACQLNRSAGRERPALRSLRGTGTLEQDGDVILLLHREDYYRKQDAKEGEEIQLDEVLEIIVAKNKSGASGVVPVRFEEQFQTISNLVPDAASQPEQAANHFDESF